MKAFVINLDHRPGRWLTLRRSFKKHNINFISELIRVKAIHHKIGAIGCFLSHLKVLKMAKQMHLKRFIILEDDTLFTAESNEMFKKAYTELPSNFHYLAGTVSIASEYLLPYSENLLLADASSFMGTNFTLYNHTFVNKLIKIMIHLNRGRRYLHHYDYVLRDIKCNKFISKNLITHVQSRPSDINPCLVHNRRDDLQYYFLPAQETMRSIYLKKNIIITRSNYKKNRLKESL